VNQLDQSLSEMCVEQAFGNFKGRWWIIMKKTNISIQHMIDIIFTYVVLHNICITLTNAFDRLLTKNWNKIVTMNIWRSNEKTFKNWKVNG